MGAMLFGACSNTDNPIDDPDNPDIPDVETVEVDVTSEVMMDVTSWNAGGTYGVNVTTTDGRTSTMVERYYSNFPCADVPLKQIVTDLNDGMYTIVLEATSNLAWIQSDVEAGSTDVAYVYAKSGNGMAVEPIVAGRETSFSIPGEYVLQIEVANGELEIGLGLRDVNKTNWHTIQIKSLKMELPVALAFEEGVKGAKELFTEQMSSKAREELQEAMYLLPVKENYPTLINALQDGVKSVSNYRIINNGYLFDEVLDNWTCTNPQGIHINTWSVEGNVGNDPSHMVVPFIENWVNRNDGTLGDGEISYTFEMLEPGDTYTISALVRAYSEAGNDISGASFFVGENKTDLATGNAFEYNGMKGIYDTYSATGTVDANGNLKFGVELSGATFNWVAIKGVKISK